MNELRLLIMPNIIRNSNNKEVKIKPYEVMLSVMLLSNKFGGISRISLGNLRQLYRLNKNNISTLKELLPLIEKKQLVKMKKYSDKVNTNTLLEVKPVEAVDGEYFIIDYNLIEKILLTDYRFDSKANAIYTLLILQSRAGYRDFNRDNTQKGYCFPSVYLLAKDTNISKTGVESSINLLEDLGIIEVVRNGAYITTNRDGKKIIKNYNNSYIIRQVNYTDDEISIIKKDIDLAIHKVNQKAEEGMIKSHYISEKIDDDYNNNRKIREDLEGEVCIYEDNFF